MKPIFTLTLSVMALVCQSQEKDNIYVNLQAVGYSTENVFGGGPHLSFGYHANNFAIGPGIGILLTTLLKDNHAFTPMRELWCFYEWLGSLRASLL